MSQLILDLENNGNATQAILPAQSISASAQGVSVNAENWDVSTNAILSVGAMTSGNVLNVQVEEYNNVGASSGSYTAIPNMVFATVGGSAAAGSGTQQVVRGQRTYQYLRANATTATGTCLLSVVAVSQGKFTASGTSFAGGFDLYPSSAVSGL